jgi:hypothetical protein
MTAPLAPVVDGPIYAVPGILILVDNVLPDALVKVLQDGGEIGHATSTSPGSIWVPTTITPIAGKHITATQTYTGSAAYVGVTAGVASPESKFAVTVLAPPKVLPVPIFQSGINQCSNAVWLGGLFQGATVTITQGGNTLGGGLVLYPSQWFTLTGPEPTPGQPVEAIQKYRDSVSGPGWSSLVAPEPTSLPKPVVATPLRDCQTFLDMSNMTPGANITVKNGIYIDTATSPAGSYTLNLPPLAAGLLTAQQTFTRCQGISSQTAVYHVKNLDLPMPKVGYALCPSLGQLTVTNLLPGEILSVSAVIEPSGQPKTVTPLGSQGISAKTATVFLPALPANTVAVEISVTLCGMEKPPAPGYVTVPVSTTTAPIGPPELVPPLYNCARSVAVTNAYPGCLVTVFSGAPTNVLANPVVATSADLVIPLWNPLFTGEHVQVEQTGCHASGQSKPLTVKGLPHPVPVPHISGPVLSDATGVTVTGVLPGAQVFLYVSGVFRSQALAVTGTVVLPINTPALTPQNYVEVVQELCGLSSRRTDGGPGYAPVQAPEPKPSKGLVGNSNYAYANGGKALTGVSVTIEITEDINLLYDSGGDLTSNSQTGYGFQVNCISPTTDATFWQQYMFVVFNNTLNAVINNWSPGFSTTGALQEVDLIDTYNGTQLKPLSGYTLPKGYTLTITLDTSNTGGTNPNNNVLSATFSGSDENNVPFGTPLTQTLTSLTDQQTGSNVQASNLSPIYVIGCYLVGPDNGEKATLQSGAGKITITTNAMTVYSNYASVPVSFNLPTWGTVEDSNATYSEVPTGSSTSFVQTFSVP